MDDFKKYVGYFKLLVNGMMAKNIAWTVAVEMQIIGNILLVVSCLLWLFSWFTIIIPIAGPFVLLIVQILGFIVGCIGLLLLLSPLLLILWPPTYREANLMKECCHPIFAVHFWGVFGMLWTLLIAFTWGLIFWMVYLFSIFFLFSWIPPVLMILAIPLFPLLSGVTVALTGWEMTPSDKKVVPVNSEEE